MPTRKLTDLFVERVKPPARGRIEYFDASFPGLALRITENGGKSWCAFYRFRGRLRRFTIGRYPAIKPAQARREAQAALTRAREGFDPATEKRTLRYAPAPQADTFDTLVRDYLERYARKNTGPETFKEAKRILESADLAAWRNRPISEISRRDVIDVIDRIARRAEVQANRTLARLRALFNWAVEKDRLTASPAAGVKPPTKERTRDRALSGDELRWFCKATEAIGWPFGPLAMLLLLTAQRRDEVGGMEWSELDLEKRTWTLPRHKSKNNRAHEVQLSDAAIKVLRSLPRIGNGPIFVSTNGRPVSGFSYGKNCLDAAMLEAKREELGAKAEAIPHWILHDLRRTAATGMARLNIPPHVVDKVLNHVSGTIRGVAAIYNRFEYLEERRTALEAWGSHVDNLMTPAVLNVVPLAGRRG
jgi:integrase